MIFRAQVRTCYQHIVTIRPFYRYLFSIIFLATLWFGWFFLIHRSTHEQIVRYQNAIIADKQYAILCEKQQQAHTKLQKKLCCLKTSLTEQCNRHKSLSIQTCFRLCQETEVSCTNIQCGTTQAKDWYTMDTLHIQIHGTLKQLLAFFTKISQESLCVCCKKLHITLDKDTLYNCNVIFDSYTFIAP